MNSKIYNGNVQPNPKEFKIWVDDEGTIKTWNGTEWIEAASGGDGGNDSGDNNIFALYPSSMIANDSNYATIVESPFFNFEEGMTWEEWIVSDYNTVFEKEHDSSDSLLYVYSISTGSGMFMENINYKNVKPTDVIVKSIYTLNLDV